MTSLKQNEEDLQDMKAANQTLTVQNINMSDELSDIRNEIINVSISFFKNKQSSKF